jgi:hypothetical protein
MGSAGAIGRRNISIRQSETLMPSRCVSGDTLDTFSPQVGLFFGTSGGVSVMIDHNPLHRVAL